VRIPRSRETSRGPPSRTVAESRRHPQTSAARPVPMLLLRTARPIAPVRNKRTLRTRTTAPGHMNPLRFPVLVETGPCFTQQLSNFLRGTRIENVPAEASIKNRALQISLRGFEDGCYPRSLTRPRGKHQFLEDARPPSGLHSPAGLDTETAARHRSQAELVTPEFRVIY
jgi:hypothetical protein